MAGLVQQSSDVRFREIDLSQVIASNSSSRGAIVFVSKKGRPGRFNVTEPQAFINEYGIPNAAVSMGHYCALDALTELTSLDCVRVVGSGAKYSALFMKANSSGVTQFDTLTGAGVADPEAFDFDTAAPTPNVPLVLFYPRQGQGSYANSLSVKILSENISPPAAPVVTVTASGGTLGAATYYYKVTAISANGETVASTPTTLVVASGTTNTLNVSWTAVAGARGYRLYGRINSGALGLIATLGATVISYADTGAVTPVTASVSPATAPATTTQFTVQVFDDLVNPAYPQEQWTCTLQDQTDDVGRQLEIQQQINAFSELIQVVSNVPNLLSAPPAILAVAKTSLSGGDSGAAPTNGAIALAWREYFLDSEKVKVQLLINGGYTDTAVQQAMVFVAESRQDAVALLDIPAAYQSAADAITYRQLVAGLTAGIDSSYGAIYTSDNFEDDPFNGKKLYVPPSGWAAAVCGRTDRLVGPQGAPAGLNRGVLPVLGTRYDYNDQERTDLFNAKINYTRKFVGTGTTLFEQVTMQTKTSAMSWLNVRRMVNVIKTSVRDYLLFSLQEPNDDFTRRQIITSIGQYLQSWKDVSGISSYLVVTDDPNKDAARYNLGILKVTIFITPIIPIHEIQVDVVVTKTGISFSELNITNLA